MRTINKIISLAALAVAIQGCGGDNGPKLQPVTPITDATALFNPAPVEGSAADFLPFPVDLLFTGSTDGSINGAASPTAAPLDSMDGFSTTATMVVRFNGPISDASLEAGLRIFQMDGKNPGPHFTSPFPVPAVDRKLEWGIDYVAGVLSGNTVLVTLLKPLQSNTSYVVTVTPGVETVAGNPVSRDTTYGLLQQLASDESIFPQGIPVALDATGTNFCDVSVPADSSNCIPNPALTDAHGNSLALAIQLETLRQITRNHLEAVSDFDGAASVAETAGSIVLSYSVSTQNVAAALDNAFAAAATPSIAGLSAAGSAPGGVANAFAGVLSGLTQFIDPAQPDTTVWVGGQGGCPLPTTNLVFCNGYVPTANVTPLSIPVLVTAPTQAVVDATCGAFTELPVVIFQHGITSHRGSLLAMADRLAGQCIIGVAIDLPKHGIASNAMLADTPIGALSLGGLERLKQTDAAGAGCNETISPDIISGDEYHCDSGDTFINLTNLPNSRDTIRQAAVDMNSLFNALEAGELTGAMLGLSKGPDVANIHFVGMSLGGIAGASFVARQPDLQTATFNVSGGGIAKILDGSPSFEPRITAGLYDAAGIIKPSGGYEGFLIIAQTVVDSVDPINYVSDIDANASVLVQSVMGNPAGLADCLLSGVGCPDLVVPNNVFGASLAPSWNNVLETGQTSFLPGQNFITTPFALAGTDPFAQGTGFVAIDGARALGAFDVTTARMFGPLGADNVAPGTFKGVGALSVGACGTGAGKGIVRFVSGSHSSLLDPAASEDVTELMQNQVASFVSSSGAAIIADTLGLVYEPAASPFSTAPCL